MADTHPVVDGPVSEDCECEYDPGSTGLVTDAVDKEEYLARASRLASLAQLDQDSEMITRGALLAHDPRGFYASDATAEEREVRACVLVMRKLVARSRLMQSMLTMYRFFSGRSSNDSTNHTRYGG